MRLTLGEIQSFVSELAAARDFYERVLGLQLTEATDKWLIFDVSGTTLILMSGAERRTCEGCYGSKSGTVVCLLSEDIDRDYATLKELGVRFFSSVNEVAEGKYVGFQDPDGNLLELIQK
jgi:catechol 2,3-dioxygenase-like lactoylglutathione lyase family enzyme